ncbi:NNP family nitrate/nitrite transporter-like MFS transporter [Allocatelliglobosispora scoriae]|uniref:NNP family nitrate/nitrite transporter-like MFS transporter n=1 Tax=Allocatelliglobosispora scoriae TaxID=643052 RepID=A0A841BQE8_9ACTN|nr:MFS transporter [Allocatelliglobosispora scoriae]MBB5868982.1 NNP family nitrate/nitrite transporter-like MFS transporter [Allocatelliglobosispora scoriae]
MTTPADRVAPGAYRNLVLAAVAFLLNSWAWGLISPSSAHYKQVLGLSAVQQSVLVAVPVLVGSLGRIPVGALTDKLGARVVLPAITFLTVLPVLALSLVGSSYAGLLVVGFFLGLGGTPFAASVPHANAWFPPAKRGFALGVVGMGMGGTAIAAVLTAPMRKHYGDNAQFYLVAAVLVLYGLLLMALLRDPPGRTVPTTSFAHRFAEASRQSMTWPLAGLYAVTFGGYVAFAVYLVTYLQTAYGLAQPDASLKAAGFTLVAVVFRPPGGWLSDRIGPAKVLAVCLAVLAVMALVQSFQPVLYPWATVSFLVMAAVLGAGAGAVFALLAQVTPKATVGSVTGIVGAVGGLGGFVPPLVMGAVYGWTDSYRIGLLLLALVALGSFLYTLRIGTHDRRNS